MAEDDATPAWLGPLTSAMSQMETRLRQDSQAMEGRLRESMSAMVTKDLFEAEQRFQLERHRSLEDRIRDERDRAEAALREERERAEAAEKALGEQLEETAKAQAAAEVARKKATTRLWYGIGFGLGTVAALVTAAAAVLHPVVH